MFSEQELTKCDSLLYADCSTAGGPPSLSPRSVVEAMTQLDGLLKKLEQVVMDVIKDIDSKKKVGVCGETNFTHTECNKSFLTVPCMHLQPQLNGEYCIFVQ